MLHVTQASSPAGIHSGTSPRKHPAGSVAEPQFPYQTATTMPNSPKHTGVQTTSRRKRNLDEMHHPLGKEQHDNLGNAKKPHGSNAHEVTTVVKITDEAASSSGHLPDAKRICPEESQVRCARVFKTNKPRLCPPFQWLSLLGVTPPTCDPFLIFSRMI